MASIEDIKKEYEDILNQLSDPELISDWEKFNELSGEKTRLEKILNKQKEVDEVRHSIEENKAIIKSGDDPELTSLADAELIQLQEKEKNLFASLEKYLNGEEDDEDDTKPKKSSSSVIIEIRAGTGGDEAALFAGDLFRMYSRYAEIKGWKTKILDSHATDLNGFKEVIFEIDGSGVYDKMKNEGGVHRVQRIPETEKAGRVHTSTASVAIMSKPKSTEIKIRPQDLKIDIAKASGPGGQNVNKRMTAVRILHLPTGIMVKSMTERTLPSNKENAMSILAARLEQIRINEEINKEGDKRRSQIGTAKRVEKIRTYNYPQDRITDHRIKKSWHSIEEMMNGKIDKMVDTLEEELKD